jgi:uncharacterized membrane protein
MKSALFITVIGIFCSVSVTQASDKNRGDNKTETANAKKAHGIIEKKCTTCHSKDKIDIALSNGKNMGEVLTDMKKKGVKLNSNESEVLGIFWKQSKPIANK